jgi:hypothetical protein
MGEGALMKKFADILRRDNAMLKESGMKLAKAAIYDGIHRLSKAVADWFLAIYDESGRDLIYKDKEKS